MKVRLPSIISEYWSKVIECVTGAACAEVVPADSDAEGAAVALAVVTPARARTRDAAAASAAARRDRRDARATSMVVAIPVTLSLVRWALATGDAGIRPVAVVVAVAVAAVADHEVEQLRAGDLDVEAHRCRRAGEHRRGAQRLAVGDHAERDGPVRPDLVVDAHGGGELGAVPAQVQP